MKTAATLTEIRADGMQKWEQIALPKADRARYIWLTPSRGVAVGDERTLEFSKGTGGAIGGHWAGWKIV